MSSSWQYDFFVGMGVEYEIVRFISISFPVYGAWNMSIWTQKHIFKGFYCEEENLLTH